ncbi:amino acid permease [Microsporum canis CBS 113480]|uniref:Amino acid permease n=1 Tax=Arthroderma otae (strain ATCC MYA-4605 / CBS 113480) TaxID=554155 RepID=C5FHP0_ARTOC|nr:amino acid permease [Microsporum canis CBS 113480]EEQ28870.1 amino acid permease [Microsporum canis CBS 113480]
MLAPGAETSQTEVERGSQENKDSLSDVALLETLGYKPVLHRTYTFLESFATTFAAGGNLAYWTNYLITAVFTGITASVIAEICSALPSAGSIYLWAAEAGGPKYGRLLGFVVAWWSTTAWTTFCASNTQSAVNYILSELTVFNVDFPKNVDDVKFRAVQWICTEVLLAIAAIVNFLPPRMFRFVFYLSSTFVLLDFLMNVIWLPIGAHNTWGFRTPHEAFLVTYNGTGAPAGWNWCLSYLATAGILIGFDASGHIAEETKNASLTAARGIFWSTVVSGIGAAITIVLFLFCAPFVPLYAVVLGKRAHVIMNVVCVITYWFVCIPLHQSLRELFSAAGVPSAAAYGLICFGRVFLTPKKFPKPRWSLGALSKPFQIIGIFWNGWVVAILFSPYVFPVTGQTLNSRGLCLILNPPIDAPIILAGVTIIALVSYWIIPEESWFPSARISKFVEGEPQDLVVEDMYSIWDRRRYLKSWLCFGIALKVLACKAHTRLFQKLRAIISSQCNLDAPQNVLELWHAKLSCKQIQERLNRSLRNEVMLPFFRA